MTRNDIADALATARNLSKAEARTMVADVLDAIAAGAAKGEVALAGFGKFSVTHRPARAGRNPRTGEAMFVAASRTVRFRPAKAFKDRVAG
ncbi:HU family DNA-binding protein [Sphingomonas sp.]|uniref:HU family DNA-binding protein n=1 Tax=Sphingomonas sp. TaxID=28214 RepID=UPI0025FE6887|nr:HU family DNA-binding protein [Sphingomonas sp.]